MKHQNKYIHHVPSDFEGEVRLRNYLKGIFPYLETGSAVKKALQKGQIQMNGTIGTSGNWVRAGSIIIYERPSNNPTSIQTEIKTLFEDEYLVIVYKPPGLASSGNTRSFQQQLQNLEIKPMEGSLPFPYLVHRLDKATEGLMIAAKTMKLRRMFADMLSQEAIDKTYIAICEGLFPAHINKIEHPIDDKIAITEQIGIEYLDTKDQVSRVKMRIHTGRTHQIRRHLQAVGHPIVGDQLYNKGGLTFKTGLLLCAYSLAFLHPITQKKVVVEATIPHKIAKYSIL